MIYFLIYLLGAIIGFTITYHETKHDHPNLDYDELMPEYCIAYLIMTVLSWISVLIYIITKILHKKF